MVKLEAGLFGVEVREEGLAFDGLWGVIEVGLLPWAGDEDLEVA